MGTGGSGSSTVISSPTSSPLSTLAADTSPHSSTHTSISQHSTHARSSIFRLLQFRFTAPRPD
jgi:hypothetical protein